MDVEHPQALGVEHQFGEGGGGVGIIDVTLLPESCHRQMIFDDEDGNGSGFRGEAEAFQQRFGEPDAAFGVALDALGFADVVEQKYQIQLGGIGDLVEGLAVF